jgi:U3 small nucleolar RNA-associated protein 3
VHDEVDRWELEQEATALKAVKGARGGRKPAARDREVLALSGTDSDTDGEGGAGEEEDLRKWGGKKKHYYGGNTGEELGSDPPSDSDMEEDRAEEVEVGKLQKLQLAAMEEEDFLDTFVPARPAAAKETKEAETKQQPAASSLARDLGKLTRKEQAALFKQQSPEFDGVTADFQLKMAEAGQLARVAALAEAGSLPAGPQLDYVKTKLQLLLNYCTNIAAYLMFRAQGTPLALHPVTGRLVQYRHLLDGLAAQDALVLPGVLALLARLDSGGAGVEGLVREERRRAARRRETGRKKKLSLLDQEEEQVVPEKKKRKRNKKGNTVDEDALENIGNLTHDERMAVELYNVIKKTKKDDDLKESSDEEDGLMDSLKPEDVVVKDDTNPTTNAAAEYDEDGEEKRAITYKIAKNKGLMPKRSKLQRNPRLKNRVKFEKAQKKRKGAVREIRDQKSKYGGEASGVNMRVKKGVKLS